MPPFKPGYRALSGPTHSQLIAATLRAEQAANIRAMNREQRIARARQQQTRAGYSSVPRTRGAAVQGETKYFDCTLDASAIPPVDATAWPATAIKDPATTINIGDAAVATPLSLFVPKPSAALNGRIGRHVLVKKVKVRGFINCPAQGGQSTLDNGAQIRLMLVQDTQTNAAQMTPAGLMNGGSAVGSTLDSFQNPNNFGRFRVLKDKKWGIKPLAGTNDTGATGGVTQGGLLIPFKFTHIYRDPVKVNFNATNGGTVSDVIDNSWHVIAACNVSDLAPTLTYYSRVSYHE